MSFLKIIIMEKTSLDKKVERAIKLLQAIPSDDIEVCFSGGKDSSVILALAKMANIKFTPIYKSTTIDPSGNIAFCKSQGCEIIRPEKNFFSINSTWWLPNKTSKVLLRRIERI